MPRESGALSFILVPSSAGVNLPARKDEREREAGSPTHASAAVTAFIMFVLKDSEVLVVLGIALRGAHRAHDLSRNVSVRMEGEL